MIFLFIIELHDSVAALRAAYQHDLIYTVVISISLQCLTPESLIVGIHLSCAHCLHRFLYSGRFLCLCGVWFFCFYRNPFLCQFFQPVKLSSFYNILTVDRVPVIRHRDDLITVVLPFFLQIGCLLGVSVVTLVIVRDQHERHTLVRIVADRIVVHAHISGAVAEGEHRLAADLLCDLQNFVSLEILDKQFVRSDNVVGGGVHVVQSLRISLAGGLQLNVHAYYLLIGDINHTLYKHAADETVAAGADIAFKAVIL